MDAWVKAALADHYVAEVDSAAVRSGVLCEAFLSPWYDDGVAFDWTALHQRLVRPSSSSSSSSQPYAAQFTSALSSFGAEAAAKAKQECFVTVVELLAPWKLHPLSDQAQDLSVFDVAPSSSSSCSSPASSGPAAADASSMPPSGGRRRFYKFLRGPPGQRAVRDDMSRVLGSVEAQLRQGGIRVCRFLSSFVILCEDFTESLQQTAAVFRALTEVGFTVDGHGSSLGPRAVQRLRIDGEDTWTTLPLQKLLAHAAQEGEDVVASLLVALFFQWLQDAYTWGCTAPVHLFPSAGSGADSDVAAQRLRLFERFVRGLVVPRSHAIGLEALTAVLPEEGGSLLELAAVQLEKKRAPVGPQRWSVLELRLVLCQIGAYAQVPSEYLSTGL